MGRNKRKNGNSISTSSGVNTTAVVGNAVASHDAIENPVHDLLVGAVTVQEPVLSLASSSQEMHDSMSGDVSDIKGDSKDDVNSENSKASDGDVQSQQQREEELKEKVAEVNKEIEVLQGKIVHEQGNEVVMADSLKEILQEKVKQFVEAMQKRSGKLKNFINNDENKQLVTVLKSLFTGSVIVIILGICYKWIKGGKKIKASLDQESLKNVSDKNLDDIFTQAALKVESKIEGFISGREDDEKKQKDLELKKTQEEQEKKDKELLKQRHEQEVGQNKVLLQQGKKALLDKIANYLKEISVFGDESDKSIKNDFLANEKALLEKQVATLVQINSQNLKELQDAVNKAGDIAALEDLGGQVEQIHNFFADSAANLLTKLEKSDVNDYVDGNHVIDQGKSNEQAEQKVSQEEQDDNGGDSEIKGERSFEEQKEELKRAIQETVDMMQELLDSSQYFQGEKVPGKLVDVFKGEVGVGNMRAGGYIDVFKDYISKIDSSYHPLTESKFENIKNEYSKEFDAIQSLVKPLIKQEKDKVDDLQEKHIDQQREHIN